MGSKALDAPRLRSMEGDMLVHFAIIRFGDRVTKLEKEIMSEWFTKIERHPDKASAN